MRTKKKKTSLPRITLLAYNRRDLVQFVEAVEALRGIAADLRTTQEQLSRQVRQRKPAVTLSPDRLGNTAGVDRKQPAGHGVELPWRVDVADDRIPPEWADIVNRKDHIIAHLAMGVATEAGEPPVAGEELKAWEEMDAESLQQVRRMVHAFNVHGDLLWSLREVLLALRDYTDGGETVAESAIMGRAEAALAKAKLE